MFVRTDMLEDWEPLSINPLRLVPGSQGPGWLMAGTENARSHGWSVPEQHAVVTQELAVDAITHLMKI